MEKKTNILDKLVEEAKKIKKPKRVVIAGADSDNMLEGLFRAADDGFVEPILVGKGTRVNEALDRLGFKDKKYELHNVYDNANVVQYALEMVKAGEADILLRGNTQTRDFLLPILNKANHMVKEGSLLTHVNLMEVPNYSKIMGISDVTILIEPSIEQRKQVIKNLVEVLNAVGIKKPNIALLSLVEKPSFHMKDTVEAQTIVNDHLEDPIADCNIVGPISLDLILSKEAAKLKNYNNALCGDFDGIVVPTLLAGNLLVKDWFNTPGIRGCGIIAGAKAPIAITGRSEPADMTYMSLAAAIAVHENQ